MQQVSTPLYQVEMMERAVVVLVIKADRSAPKEEMMVGDGDDKKRVVVPRAKPAKFGEFLALCEARKLLFVKQETRSGVLTIVAFADQRSAIEAVLQEVGLG